MSMARDSRQKTRDDGQAHAKTDGDGQQKGDDERVGHPLNQTLARRHDFVCTEERRLPASRRRDSHGSCFVSRLMHP